MTPAQLAEARSRGYGLLARLLVEGATPELMARVRETPLAETLAEDDADLEALAASHHALFQLEVFPYAGLFLSADGLVGGDCAAAFSEACRTAGFAPSVDAASPDHLSGVLGLLAFLAGAEADALEDGVSVESVQQHLRSALDGWLLSWLVPLHAAVDDAGSPFWRAVVDMMVALAVDHRAALGGEVTARALPEPPADLLEQKKTGLKRIAEYLLTPAFSGVFLSRSDIATLARGRDTPRGFGGRLQMLANLLRNAAEYNDLPGLIEALDALLDRRAQAAGALGLSEAAVSPWTDRIQETRALLGEVRGAVSPSSQR